MELKLFLISQEENNEYDTYDSAIVVAESEEEAKTIHPSGYGGEDSWTSNLDKIKVIELGYLTTKEFEKGDVVCSSFNAG